MILEMGLRENIRKEIGRLYGGNLSKFAKAVGVSNSYLNEILNGKQRWNEDFLNKISKVLKIEPSELLADEPLIPYSHAKEQHASHFLTDERYENIKLFPDSVSLGPGNVISEIPPSDYLPFLKKLLPKGYKSDPDRIVAFPATGISMKPTIMPGSIIWIDRKDIQPREGEIYAFWLADRHAITIKRLIKLNKRGYGIIDGDNQNEEDRKTEDLRDFPMVIDLRGDDQGDVWPIRGRVIWVLNRFIEEPKK